MFHLTISKSPPPSIVTKRALASDIAKVFDVLGWFSPATITMKILLQRLWESWRKWRSELSVLSTLGIPWCYFPKEATVCSVQIHGFSDASEAAYAGVVYFRTVDSAGNVHISLITSNTKVSPIKRLSIPRLELCGAQVLARLMQHLQEVLQLSMSDVYAWTDSTIINC